jgi:hypothetical protein
MTPKLSSSSASAITAVSAAMLATVRPGAREDCP